MHIHIADVLDDNVRMILPPSANGQARTVYTYTVSGLNSPFGMAFDGTHIHIVDATDDNVRMILPPSANGQARTVYTYTASGLINPFSMVFDGTHIHIADDTNDNVRMILPPSANGPASTVYTYTVSGVSSPQGMAFDGTHIHIADFTDGNVRMILPPSANGQARTVYTYTVSGVSTPRAMAFDGTHIHIADDTNDNVRMILPPSANGQARTVYTYTVSGVSSPQGMTFDGPLTTPPVATTLSIVSGNNQSGTVSTALANPLIVQVNDQNGNPMEEVSVSFATTGGSLSSATATTGSDGRASVTLTLPGTAGSVTVTASVAGISTRPTFTATAMAVAPPEPAANLVVTISGTTNIQQGARTTLTAAVEDGSGNAITTGLEYAWTASRGRFVGSTTGASVVYEANFTDSDNIDVAISCAVRQPANNNPTSSGPSLTALTEIGITGQLVNMYMTALGAVGSNRNNILWNSGVGTLDSGSDRQIKSDLSVRQLRWANDINRFIVNGEGGASIGDYFSGNTNQSVYIIFEGGTYVEIPSSNLASGGTGFAQFNVTDSAIRTLLNNLQTTSDLTVGIADAGSIGIPADSGTGTATVTAAAVVVVARPVYTAPSAQSVNEGAVYSLNLNSVFSGATRYSLRTGNEAYVGISGSTVSFTAPQVNTDTNINLLVRATNAGGDTDASIQVTIKQVAALPTWTAPSAQSVNEGTVYRIDLADQSTRATSYALQGTNARYVGISGSVVSFTAPDVTEDTTITINVRLTNADGHIDRSFTVLIRYVPEPLVATTLAIVSGNNQSAQVGNALANPLVVQVNDQNGDPLASVTVGFSTTGGTLSAPSSTTDANGRASVRLTLPNTAGSVTVTASVARLTNVLFTATATERLVATTLQIVSGNNQSAEVGSRLTNPLVVRVLDQNGNALSGVQITFAANPTDGELSITTRKTDALGRVSTIFTLGTMVGTYTITASVAGLTDVSFTATANAIPLVATVLQIVSGNNQSAEAGASLRDALVVRVLDQFGNPLSAVTVGFTATPAGGSFSQTTVTTNTTGEASTSFTLGTTDATYRITASVTGLAAVTFIASVAGPEGLLKLRARSRDGCFGDHTIEVFVFPRDAEPPTNPENSRFRFEVEGHAIPPNRISKGLSIQSSLDIVQVNRHTIGTCNVPINNFDGYFRSDIADNFWNTHGLNAYGYGNQIEIYIDYLVNDEWEAFLIFQGQITGLSAPLAAVSKLQCFSSINRYTRQELTARDIGIPKVAELTSTESQQDTPIQEGLYFPESEFLPLTVASDPRAYHHETELTLKEVRNNALGARDNTGFLSDSDLKTQGGVLEDPLLLKTFVGYQYRPVKSAIEALTKSQESPISVYARFDDVQEVGPHVSVRGSIAHNTETGRTVRFPTDWVYDPHNRQLFILLANAGRHVRDQLVVYRLSSDSYHVLTSFDADRACYKLASSDFNTFYILSTDAAETDGSDPAAVFSEAEARKLDGGGEILQYVSSENWTDVLVPPDTTPAPPQVGVHFHYGFASRAVAWQGNAPGRYAAFTPHQQYIYYRYATADAFGVARVNPTGNAIKVASATRDRYENHLNFAFCFDVEGGLYFAYVEGDVHGSFLNVDRVEGIETTRVVSIESTEAVIDKEGEALGIFLGVYEALVSDDFLYLVVPVGRGSRDIDLPARSVLYRYGLRTGVFEMLDVAELVHYGFAGLTAHTETGDAPDETAVYYAQAPLECYQFPADTDFLSDADAMAISEFRGGLKRVLPTGEVEDLGTTRFDADGAFRGLACAPIVFEEGLHLMVAQGGMRNVEEAGSVASQASGVLWCEFGRKLRFTLDRIPTTGTLDAALSQMAQQVNAAFGVNRNILHIENRTVIGATLERLISEDATQLQIRNLNRRDLPKSGHLLINDEILGYSNVIEHTLTGLARGVVGTTAATHLETAEIVFLDGVLGKNDIVSKDIFWKLDTAHLYNVIKDENELVRIHDAFSVFDEKPLTVNMDLDSLRIPWAAFIAGNYLHRFQQLRFLLEFDTRAWHNVNLGDVVGFFYDAMLPAIAMQVMSITERFTTMQLTCREASADIRAFLDTVVKDSEETFRIVDANNVSVLADNQGNHAIFGGVETEITPIPMRFVDEVEDLILTQFEAFGPIKLPEAVNGNGGYTYSIRDIPDGTHFNAHSREYFGTPTTPQAATGFTYTATDLRGIKHSVQKNITVNPATRTPDRVVDVNGNPVLVDSTGNVAIFYGS